MPDNPLEDNQTNYLTRPRISALLANSIKHPLTIVRAGAGYGKTYAVFDFARGIEFPSLWMRFSEQDNAGSRFWTKFIQFAAWIDEAFAGQCKMLGFPDTEDKLNQFADLRKRYAPNRRRLVILDDVHLLHHPNILLFLERLLHDILKNTSVILISRELPAINLTCSQMRGLIPTISEDDLRFTEPELALYLHEQGLTISPQSRHDIIEDTNGWAFSVNLIARALKKSPGYAGYVRIAMKQNIFRLMEAEVFDLIPEKLQHFLVRFSLIDHLPADMIKTLANGDEELLDGLKRQNAYIRLDGDTGAWLIHHLFLDFLRMRQSILTNEEICETYRIAADWCRNNGFETDALDYWEKIGDYGAIVSLLTALSIQIPTDIALRAVSIFENAPAEIADNVFFFAAVHVRVVISLGRWEEALSLMRSYEERFLRLPKSDPFRNQTMCAIYLSWGSQRALLSTMDDCHDAERYYAKMNACLTTSSAIPDQYIVIPIGFWASLIGSPRKGAPQEYIESASRVVKHFTRLRVDGMAGLDDLCRGELLFYQGYLQEAESVFLSLLLRAPESEQFEIEYKALFYLLRLALLRGARGKAEQALEDMVRKSEKARYAHHFLNRDAAWGWYYCTLRRPEMVPAWLRERFASYKHAYFIENLGNQIKARYHYLTQDYAPLLAYIGEMKKRESILYGRIEMLAMEACIYLQMKNQDAALATLRTAYEEAAPNDITLPFIEFGKDMRTLTAVCLRKNDTIGSHAAWLEMIKRKSASYAKYQSLMALEYAKANGRYHESGLSKRESEILSDLYYGLSRSEIAVKQNLSINTVHSVIDNIFNKLGARSVADVVRIAAEEKLV